MKKWGVRLLGCIFLLWTLKDLISVLTGNPQGFLGFFWGPVVNGVQLGQLDIPSWIGIVITARTGYYLIKLDEWGRRLALILLWPLLIGSGIYFIVSIIETVNSLRFGKPISITIRLLGSNWPGRIDQPFIMLLAVGGISLFYGLIIYFLSKKDTKSLFRQLDTALEKS